jgi:hypothetical protein
MLLPKKQSKFRGTIIKLFLKNPTTKAHLDTFGEVLINLPSDEGSYECFYGFYGDVINKLPKAPAIFERRGRC